jgi:hypothetical protein
MSSPASLDAEDPSNEQSCPPRMSPAGQDDEQKN